MIDLRLLGPLEATTDAGPLELPPGKPSALLVRLLLDAGRMVPADTLVAALWEDPPPASAGKVLQGYVSRLRKALGAERIATVPPGYVLHVARDEYDLARFETLLEAARDAPDVARRAPLYRQALALWRGPALTEFRNEPFARAAAQRLAELRLAALEQRVDAELELGRHEDLVAELEALVAEEPLRERLRGQLMTALYRSGRQAEALARYREGRRLLVEQLGIEPGPALQELERAILRQEPALQPASAAATRGCVVCAEARLLDLAAPLCRDGRELLLVELVEDAADLPTRSSELEALRRSAESRGLRARVACFTSASPAEDLARVAAEQDAELVLAGPVEGFERPPCDAAIAPRPELQLGRGPVLVPFGGGRDEWAAVELGAWLARAHGVSLRLLGREAAPGERDASRVLASATLALQRFTDTVAESAVVPPGAAGILAQEGSVIVAALPADGLDATRRELAQRTTIPLLLVVPGLRPSGLAPDRTLTRFSWSLADE
jgi:DNA-binding SARP family transcriptional activator